MENRYVRIAILAAAAALSGCAFSPATQQELAAAEPLARPVAPDPKAARLPSLETRHFELLGDERLIGETQVLFTRFENTFALIAREYNLGYEELRHANPGVDHWLPGEDTPVYLPTQSILPDAPREGIVLNLPSMRLLYFTRETVDVDGGTEERPFVTSHPIGIGREGWATPTGGATVTQRARDPVWYPPASVRAEHEALGDPLPSVVPAGPDNPLGSFALKLSMPGYLIHGTNKPSGVGMRVSHGCIRLYPEDIEALYERVPSGTPVAIVNQPVLAAWQDGELYLEVHKPLAEDERDLSADAARLLAAELAEHEEIAAALDAETVARVVREQRGIPFPVLRSERTPEQYLAASRIIENTAPLPESESTAQAK
jgi:L,D-transpeptidase ErfK/SrfK